MSAPPAPPAEQLEENVTGASGGAIEEVTVQQAWLRLESDPACIMVDVRTQAEWAFVGLPDLSRLGKQPILMEWSTFPSNKVHDDFAERLESALSQTGTGKDTEILFLCRSGGRSMMAARTMAARGYARCRNVMQGFEGNLDPTRHRGTVDGWKAKGLPWVQG
jgi:rhodanese-related sulfurtransferase